MGSEKSGKALAKAGVTQGSHVAGQTALCLGSSPRTWWGRVGEAPRRPMGPSPGLRMLTGTLAALGEGGRDSPDSAPAALDSPGSGPVPLLAAACSPPPERCEAGSAAADSSKVRMKTRPEYLSQLGLPALASPGCPDPRPHLTLCGQPAGAQVQLLVGLPQLLALHLQLCPLQLQPHQAAPQFPAFTLELPSLPRHLSQ